MKKYTLKSVGRVEGLEVWGGAQVTIAHSTISGNGEDGLHAFGSAIIEIRDSIIENNGMDSHCDQSCNGILSAGHAQITISDSLIRTNNGWGIVAWLAVCGYENDDFSGSVTLQGTNKIIDNNKSGKHEGEVCPNDTGEPPTHSNK